MSLGRRGSELIGATRKLLPVRTTVPREGTSSRRFRPSVRSLWLAVLVIGLGYLILVPVAMVVYNSFRSTPIGTPGPLGLGKYVEAYTSRSFVEATRNSLIFAVSSSVIAFTLGCYLAWVTERTNAPFRKFIYAFILIPVVVPGVLTTVSWVLVLNETIGLANWILAAVGLPEVFDAYTMSAMIWADATDSITLPFLLMAAAFRVMDPSLEEASTAAGATNAMTIRRVTLPLMTPAVMATLLIVFIKTIENFEVPAAMGLPGGITTFSTSVWLATSRIPRDTNLASAFAMAYVAITIVGLILYYRATGSSEKFTTITGKGFKPLRMDLGSSRYLHSGLAAIILFVAVIVPALVMIYASLLPFYRVPGPGVLANMTLDNYRWVLDSPQIARALKNTIYAGLSASIAAVVLAALVSWVVVRTRMTGRKLLDALAFVPIALPGVVIGLALMLVYLHLPVPIYGTVWLIAIAYLTANIPYALRATHASMSQVGKELEEASAACGASFRRTFIRITMPLMTGGLFVAFVYTFSRTVKNLSLPMILGGPGTEVLAVSVFDLYEEGRYPRLNALGILMFLFLVVVAFAAQRIGKRFGYSETDAAR